MIFQAAVIPKDNTSPVTVVQTQQPGYFLTTVAFSPSVSTDGQEKLFFAGIAEDKQNGFFGPVILRATMNATLSIAFDPLNDVINPTRISVGNCYDIYTSVRAPKISIVDNTSILVVFPGQCSMAVLVRFQPGVPFGGPTTVVMVLPLVNLAQEYISSSEYDPNSRVLYFAKKTYQTPGALIMSLDVALWKLTGFSYAMTGEIDPILASGIDNIHFLGTIRFLYVASSGSNRIFRFDFFPNRTSTDEYGWTSLDSPYNKVSSLTYMESFLFFGTNEPNAVIGNFPVDNFCYRNCNSDSYCVSEGCNCKDGFAMDMNNPDKNGHGQCTADGLVKVINVVVINSKLSIVFGVFFGVNLLVGGFGWYLWYRLRQSSLQSGSEAAPIIAKK
jgi:hypothetical protein